MTLDDPNDAPYPPTSSWFIVDYEKDHYGLKGGDGVSRGVPEGSLAEWQALLDGIRANLPEVIIHKRLAYDRERGIYSRRNSNDDVCFRMDDPVSLANLVASLLLTPSAWASNGLPVVR